MLWFKGKPIKGNVLFEFRGRTYIEQPKRTYVKDICEESQYTLVKLKRDYHFIEIVTIAISLFLVIINFLGYSVKQEISYSSIAFYADEKLYINIENFPTNMFDLKISLDDAYGNNVYSGRLDRGKNLWFVEIPKEEIKDAYTLTIEVLIPFAHQTKSAVIQVRNYQLSEGD